MMHPSIESLADNESLALTGEPGANSWTIQAYAEVGGAGINMTGTISHIGGDRPGTRIRGNLEFAGHGEREIETSFHPPLVGEDARLLAVRGIFYSHAASLQTENVAQPA
ncbi:MAG TPA: hypothetical protein VGS28_00910 [Candidatus Saccharimonadales bacterium]|nr:hypothetical protein [Candidatus Saccharimonadales bacterium]